jgi:GMP synthase-like glutamine amidotransferase
MKFYIGKELVNLRKSFFSLPWVSPLLEGLDSDDLEELYQVGIFKVHSDLVSKLPEGAVLQGSSNRCHNEIWTIGD